MKKTLIAALIAGIPAVAAADVTVYGIMKGGIENVKVGDAASATNVDDLGSRIGFKGSEDLGNGLKAIWQIETAVDLDDGGNSLNAEGENDGNNTWATRDTFVGLASDFGNVKLGYNSNFSNSDMGVINFWENGSDALGLSIFTRADDRLKDSIRLETPTFAGLKAVYVHGVDENKEVLNTAGDRVEYTKDGRVNSIGLQYDIAGLTAQYMYEIRKDAFHTADRKEDAKQQRLELSYVWNNWFFGAGYAQSNTPIAKGADTADFETAFGNYVDLTKAGVTVAEGDEVKARDAALSVGYTYGAFTPKFSYAKGWDVKVNGNKVEDSGYDQYILGVDYALSKRTIAGASFGKISYDTADNQDVKAFGVSLIHKF